MTIFPEPLGLRKCYLCTYLECALQDENFEYLWGCSKFENFACSKKGLGQQDQMGLRNPINVFLHFKLYGRKSKEIARVGPDIRQCRIIRPDFSFCRISGISGWIQQAPDIRHPVSGKKYQIRPNPRNCISLSQTVQAAIKTPQAAPRPWLLRLNPYFLETLEQDYTVRINTKSFEVKFKLY